MYRYTYYLYTYTNMYLLIILVLDFYHLRCTLYAILLYRYVSYTIYIMHGNQNNT